ncbi:hypothetical protein RUND412_011107, partial [Rhizina undulata]
MQRLNGCRSNDEDEQDENDVAESDADKEMIQGEDARDVPDWARWIWMVIVLYWIAIEDGEDDY